MSLVPTCSPVQFDDHTFDSPLLWMLNDVAASALDLGFIVVYPSADGWGQSFLSRHSHWPPFCQLVQATEEGSKHCKMCHVLMAVAACTQGTTEQKCHTGVSAFVSPVSLADGETLAVISTCVTSPQSKKTVWEEAKRRGKQLGIDLRRLKKAYRELRELNSSQVKLLQSIICTAAEAIKEIAARRLLEKRLTRRMNGPHARAGVRQILESAFKAPHPGKRGERGKKGGRRTKRKGSALVEVVASLVNRNPGMPFSVSEIAAAARMTPNHFSTLFRQCRGQNFLEYLTDRRVDLARELLRNLTLNIGEVAARCGYADPGYFARIFKQRTGVTPRVWREGLFPA